LAGAIDFDYRLAGQEYRIEGAALAMPGRHQAANAAAALAAISELRHQGWCISNDAIRAGLPRAALAGRVEIIASRPMIVLDTAHNPASARALVETLNDLAGPSRRGRHTLIVSISHDKDVPAIVRELTPHFERVIVTQYQENPRAVPIEELFKLVSNVALESKTEVVSCSTPQAAWQFAVSSAAPGECICIAGSFYLAAEMRPLVQTAVASELLIR
jgi:dihydrofolate synthase/folylpolyglutamate synthase